ncbi:MAG: hypothetical protein L0027_12330 [Candidatus Rokubacteria bacterium]|nr:hypothetical protein [Candidatus Rokubacteria bacterium]
MKLLVLGLVAALAAGCNTVPDLAVIGRYGPMDFDGDIGVSSSGVVATTSTESLGIEEDDGVISPRVDFSWLAVDVWGSFYDAQFEGEGTLEADMDFGGSTITAGEPTDTVFNLMLGTSAITLDLVPGDTFDLGIGVGFGYIDWDAEITSQTSSETIASTETFFMPLAAVRAAIEWSSLELSVLVAGFAVNVEEDEAEIFDGDAMLRWHFLNAGPMQGGVVAGYRMTMVDALYESGGSTFDADFEVSGPYAGLTLEF